MTSFFTIYNQHKNFNYEKKIELNHILLLLFKGFRVEAIWGRTNEEAAATAFSLDIPFATNRIDDVLLRKDVDLILILCSPLHHSQIAVKALGNPCQFMFKFCP